MGRFAAGEPLRARPAIPGTRNAFKRFVPRLYLDSRLCDRAVPVSAPREQPEQEKWSRHIKVLSKKVKRIASAEARGPRMGCLKR